MYSINLSPEGRLLSASPECFAPEAQLKLEKLPEGELSDWVLKDGRLSLEPLPRPDIPEALNPINELRELIDDNTLAIAEILGGGV